MIRSKSNMRFQILANFILILFTIFVITPFILLIMSSFTEESTLIRNGYSFFPEKFSLGAYAYIWKNASKIMRAYGITILVTVVGTAVNVMLSTMIAYPLSLEQLPGRRAITFYLFFTMLFSGGLVPSYLLYSNYFHIKNTIWALIVPNLLLSAMSVLLIRTYISTSIPSALFEAAKVDGAGEFTVFFKLVIPLSKPIIVTMGTFAGLGYWNDWTNGLYYLTDTKYYSIQNLLNKMITDIQVLSSNSSMVSQASSEMAKLPTVGVRMAIAVVAMLPIFVLFPFLQKYFQKGIALGAVKG